MKSWEPEHSFDRADFPRQDQEGSGEEEGKKSPKKSPPNRNTPADPPAWTPERIDPGQARVFRGRGPGTSSGKESGTEQAAGSEGSKEAGPVQGTGAADRSGLLPRFVQEASLKSPENTIRLLRSWYWEKRMESRRAEGAIYTVAPHDRIRIILSLLGERIQTYLFGLMAPGERGQLNELLKSAPEYSPATLNLVGKEFMRLLSRIDEG